MTEPASEQDHRGIRIVGWIAIVAGLGLIGLTVIEGVGLEYGVAGAGSVLLGTVMILRPGRVDSR